MKKWMLALVAVLIAVQAQAADPKALHAVKELTAAITLIDGAAPIYRGQRADADAACRDARTAILIQQKLMGKRKDTAPRLKDDSNGHNFQAKVVGKSQDAMKKALAHIQNAMADFKLGGGKFDETAPQIKSMRAAIVLVRKCLGAFDGE